MKNRVGFKRLDGVRHVSVRPPNGPAVNMQRITVGTPWAMPFRLYQDSIRVTSHFLGLRRMQERDSFLGGHFHIVGTPGNGTTEFASVPARRPKALADGPVVERCTL
jgi:hypothetical protein